MEKSLMVGSTSLTTTGRTTQRKSGGCQPETLEARRLLSSTGFPGPYSQVVNAVIYLEMKQEAQAWAIYQAYATIAKQEGHPVVADLWYSISQVELEDHFNRDAQLLPLVKSDSENLSQAVGAVNFGIVMYEQDIKDATAAHNTVAVNAFRDYLNIENTAKKLFTAAGQNISKAPLPPIFSDVQVRKAKASATGITLADFTSATWQSSFEYAEFTYFARNAASNGNARLAALFNRMADTEYRHSFNSQVNLAGLLSNTRDNLAKSDDAEGFAEWLYGDPSLVAQEQGYTNVANTFRQNDAEEAGHDEAFSDMLDLLEAGYV